jgi:hypothetical protein
VIVQHDVAPPSSPLSEAKRGTDFLDPLWKNLVCPKCGAHVEPSAIAYHCWNIGGADWCDGHVELACRACGRRGVDAFDLSPIARFPRLAAQLAGLNLATMAFEESFTVETQGIDERTKRTRTWTGGGATIVLVHGTETNYPPNEMQWYFNHDASASLVAFGMELSVREDLRAPATEDADLRARWLALL